MAGRPDIQPELTLRDLMADPMVRAIMRADGIDERELRELLLRASAGKAAQAVDRSDAKDVGLTSSEPFRHGVGIMLLNRDGRVFVGRRCDVSGEAWQMPQGESILGKPRRPRRFANCRRKSAQETSTSSPQRGTG